ncbi:transmembrane and ubiquitin-like domain-containing protein 2 [Toxotes jaculatrix]|uniref:transmembrane and ubiquitin-like domain-containing protein 2 n=1 Tax=Toxotes jaculatrix TaxID=941984 RepID=UPI001B3AC6DC|nr:transmembrane and ubiquitin-like domain-containing protein 2 [Toxotes jaculatrix]XP_040917857.1 transmembrane and ubiquitin-like domain-containing protein 2 [Toxotes jaculatrix]XP_040917858.1 transmembrane and ubiquitin-like domain-containing protein 2 [Toxotes jaculatrix]
MAVCALTMLDGMEEEVTAAGGMLLLVLALVLAWLSTHVADRGDHILGTILTVGAHASLIGLGGHDSYGGGSPSADTPEQQTPPPSQENKPDDGEPGTERGEGEGAEGVRTDLLLDIQSKQPQAGGLHTSDEDDDEVDEEEDEEEELEMEDKKVIKSVPVLTSTISPTTTTTISVRLKFLNDTEEVAVVEPQDTVGVLKSKYFSGREHQIKLIYQGQLLQDPKKTLLSLNITHNSVIHCHITQALHEASPEEGAQSGAGAGVGSGVSGGFRAAGVAISTSSLVVPVFVVVLAVVWYFRINYRQFFTAPATISLVGVTVFFSFLIFGMHSR